ncbi:MAG: hypothetical protein ACYDAG_00405 [Chloroflexota bacterium]
MDTRKRRSTVTARRGIARPGHQRRFHAKRAAEETHLQPYQPSFWSLTYRPRDVAVSVGEA